MRSFSVLCLRLARSLPYTTRTHRNPARFALIWDRQWFQHNPNSWFMHLCQVLQDFLDPNDLVKVNPVEDMDRCTGIVMAKCRVERVEKIEGSEGIRFLLSWFGEAISSPNFRQKLGLMEYELARVFILFMGNAWRWSIFTTPQRKCPACQMSLYSKHFFDCGALSDRPTDLLQWADFIDLGRRGEWLECAAEMKKLVRWWGSKFPVKHEVLEVVQ